MREGHDLVFGTKRSFRQKWKLGGPSFCTGNMLRGARPGTRTRVTQSHPIRHMATPSTSADAGGQTPRSSLRAGGPTWKRGLPTPIIPCSWIPLGPLTHLDWDLRSTKGLGRDRSLRLCDSGPLPPGHSPVLPSRAGPGGNRAQSPGPAPFETRLQLLPPGLLPHHLIPLHPLRIFLCANHISFEYNLLLHGTRPFGKLRQSL